MDELTIHRLAAFTTDPAGGNPAGVVVTDEALPVDTMQRVAADVGYSETAFLVPDGRPGRWDVRYFAPEAEVPFCGHATIAAGVLLGARGDGGRLTFTTPAGEIGVTVDTATGVARATLVSTRPTVDAADPALVDAALGAMGWRHTVLAEGLPVAVADAGARHLVLPVATRDLLAALRYQFDDLRAVMADARLTTVAVVWRAAADHYHARNPFPVGGVVEDPATGAAAAALGAYLRHHRLVDPPATVRIDQGVDMGRPSVLTVDIPAGRGGIAVSGTAVHIAAT
jgi:PhzF family phenazine biosynthesis protein